MTLRIKELLRLQNSIKSIICYPLFFNKKEKHYLYFQHQKFKNCKEKIKKFFKVD